MLRQLVVLSLFAVAVEGQLPTDAVLILEQRVAVNDPVFVVVDSFGRGQPLRLREQNAFVPMVSVATDPDLPTQFWFESDGTSLAGSWRVELGPLARIRTSTWGNWGRAAATRLEVGSSDLFRLEQGALVAHAKAGGAARTLLPASGSPIDLAVEGQLVFVAYYDAAVPAPIVAYDTASSTSRTVTSLPGILSLAAVPGANEVLLGTDRGDLVRVDTVAGQVMRGSTPTAAPRIDAIAVNRAGLAVFTDGNSVWSSLSGNTPLYTSNTAILDLGIGQPPTAAVLPYGTACTSSGNREATAIGLPSVPNPNFALGMRGGSAGAASLLVLGPSRSFSTVLGTPLPVPLDVVGLTGCELWADPVVGVSTVLDGAGAATVPLPIPAVLGLRGREIGSQWITGAPGTNRAALVTLEAIVVLPF